MATVVPDEEVEKSLQFLSKEFDDIKTFSTETTAEINSTRHELTRMATELKAISKRASEIEDSIEAILQYSYNYNLKIAGIPQKPGETALQSSKICVKLFQKIGASNVTLQDIDIAHRVPKRKMKRDYSEPPAIICQVHSTAGEKPCPTTEEICQEYFTHRPGFGFTSTDQEDNDL